MKSTADVAIIGLGIAGATLAIELRNRGVQVCAFDDPAHGTVSRGAAGLISPVAGLRFGVLDEWQQWWDHASAFYGSMQAIEPIPCYRLLYGEDERRYWQRKRQRLADENLADEGTLPAHTAQCLTQPAEVVAIRTAARVHAARVLDTVAQLLDTEGRLCRRWVAEEEVTPIWAGWRVGGIECAHVVFCQGPALAASVRFGWLPRMFARGQRIAGTLAHSIAPEPVWLSIRGKSLLLEGRSFSFGSTFDWETTEPIVTEQSTGHLRRQLELYLRVPFRIEQAWAGVRPIMADLKPAIGEHPQYRRCWLFNGLGSRGLLLAPRLASILAEAIVSDAVTIPPQFDLRRFAC
ncbi:MAG: FAD-dependent oxidoreductase [Candidatus Kapaibacterium sp.]|nr:MAG: FAD-dependent oxidoreductase [Candidatus Kapabacteria bacterium]